MNRHHALAILLLTAVTPCQAAENPAINARPESAPAMEQTTETIGSAKMEADGTLVLQLMARSDDGTIIGDGLLRYPPGHPDYDSILRHVGPLKPGEECLVRPWPAAADRGVVDDKTLLTKIQAQLDQADAEIANRDFENANNTLNAALDQLGNRYSDPRVIDDSGMKLIAARDQDRNGRPENAAQVRIKVLRERLRLLTNRIH